MRVKPSLELSEYRQLRTTILTLGFEATLSWSTQSSSAPDTNVAHYPRLMYYYHPDYLGHVEYITDLDGTPYQYFYYTAWGETLLDQKATRPGMHFDSPYRFNGKELDEETGLYYYGARYYNPTVSVWLGVDPLAGERSWLTPYNFVQNNPIMLWDPTGMIDTGPEDTGPSEWRPFMAPPTTVPSASDAPETVLGPVQIPVENQQNQSIGPTLPESTTSSSMATVQSEGSNSLAAATLALIASDVSVPDPSDAALPKWIFYGVAATAAGVYIHANSKKSNKPNIVYEIYSEDPNNGRQTMKYGVSSQKDYVTRPGNPRPESQVRALNASEPIGSTTIYNYVILARTSCRSSALTIETSLVRAYQATHNGFRPPLQIRP